jgi:hypothetical protein
MHTQRQDGPAPNRLTPWPLKHGRALELDGAAATLFLRGAAPETLRVSIATPCAPPRGPAAAIAGRLSPCWPGAARAAVAALPAEPPGAQCMGAQLAFASTAPAPRPLLPVCTRWRPAAPAAHPLRARALAGARGRRCGRQGPESSQVSPSFWRPREAWQHAPTRRVFRPTGLRGRAAKNVARGSQGPWGQRSRRPPPSTTTHPACSSPLAQGATQTPGLAAGRRCFAGRAILFHAKECIPRRTDPRLFSVRVATSRIQRIHYELPLPYQPGWHEGVRSAAHACVPTPWPLCWAQTQATAWFRAPRVRSVRLPTNSVSLSLAADCRHPWPAPAPLLAQPVTFLHRRRPCSCCAALAGPGAAYRGAGGGGTHWAKKSAVQNSPSWLDAAPGDTFLQ